jgi:hypothetical protein
MQSFRKSNRLFARECPEKKIIPNYVQDILQPFTQAVGDRNAEDRLEQTDETLFPHLYPSQR